MVPMPAVRRRLGPWLAGLFVIAQIFGVVSLISSHVAHIAETKVALFADGTTVGDIPHSRHYRGDADGFVQHRELKDLNGAFLGSAIRSSIVLVPAALADEAPRALPKAEPVHLDRPPKTFLSA